MTKEGQSLAEDARATLEAIERLLDGWRIPPGPVLDRVRWARFGPPDELLGGEDGEVVPIDSETVRNLMAQALPVMERKALALSQELQAHRAWQERQPITRWQRVKSRIRYRWSRVRAWRLRLFRKPRPLPALEAECEHEVEPTDNPDWGRCKLCGDSTFLMTDRAAYGEPECKTCKDTGLVPVEPPPDRPGAFADARCPDCSGGSA